MYTEVAESMAAYFLPFLSSPQVAWPIDQLDMWATGAEHIYCIMEILIKRVVHILDSYLPYHPAEVWKDYLQQVYI